MTRKKQTPLEAQAHDVIGCRNALKSAETKLEKAKAARTVATANLDLALTLLSIEVDRKP